MATRSGAPCPACLAGDTVVFVPQFDPHAVWRAVQRHRANVLMIIGDAMARPLIEAYQQEDYDVSSLLAISSNAALFSPSVKEQYLTLLPNVVITDAIGASETGFTGLGYVSAGNKKAEGPTVTGGPSTIVIDENDRPVGPGGIGRIARGGHIPLGYYKDPVKTAALFAEVDGVRYAVPGDYARVEEDGTITLLGRGNTCVNTGGEKVYPEEVEGALKSFGSVFDALVIGVPDERLGQRVAALVQPRDGHVDRPDGAGGTSAHADRGLQGAEIGVAGRADQQDAGGQGRLPLGPALRRGSARRRSGPGSRGLRPGGRSGRLRRPHMRTPLCDQLGIEYPIVGFTPSEHVAAAISRAGGLGVLGCVRFNDAAELDKVLDWMDASTDGRPYGIDVVMPAKIPAEGAAIDLNQLIPAGHREFVDQTLVDPWRAATARDDARGGRRRAGLAALGCPRPG